MLKSYSDTLIQTQQESPPFQRAKNYQSSLERVNVFALQKLACSETRSFIPLVLGGNKIESNWKKRRR
jgi:hypothetical protein